MSIAIPALSATIGFCLGCGICLFCKTSTKKPVVDIKSFLSQKSKSPAEIQKLENAKNQAFDKYLEAYSALNNLVLEYNKVKSEQERLVISEKDQSTLCDEIYSKYVSFDSDASKSDLYKEWQDEKTKLSEIRTTLKNINKTLEELSNNIEQSRKNCDETYNTYKQSLVDFQTSN